MLPQAIEEDACIHACMPLHKYILYTNIPHNLLLDSISQLIREAYRIRGAKYIVIKNGGIAYWSNTISACDYTISEDQLLNF